MSKKLLMFYIVILISFASVFLSSCDSGLKIVGIEIIQYPKNIVYVIGEDNEIDLTGGKVRLITAEGQTADILMNEEKELDISSNANFNQPGVYIVTIFRTDDVYCQFPIQVVRSCSRE